MVIAIDGTTLCDPRGQGGAGIEHYTWSVVFSLPRRFPEHRFVVTIPRILPASVRRALMDGCANLRLIAPVLPHVPFLSRHVFLPVTLALFRPDVLLAPGGVLPWAWRGRSVLVVHDVAIFEHPEWFPEASVTNWNTKWLVPRSLSQAKTIVAVSRATAERLSRVFPDTINKIAVVPEGVWVPEEEDGENNEPKVEDTILFLGTLEPRKNIVSACKAVDRFLTAHPDRATTTRFVLAGRRGWKTSEIEETIQGFNDHWRPLAGKDVALELGYVNEQQKWALLRKAAVILFPSWDEGFGRPVLEAMAAGTPVICSNRGALPEVGGEAVMLVEPDDISTMALLLAQCVLLPEAVQELREVSQARAREFSMDRMAEGLMQVLESTITTSSEDTR